MKVHISPPKNKDLFYHEAQTARKARYIIGGLQLLSGATALIGLRIYFDEWLSDMHLGLQYLIMAGIALVLVAPGEMGIRETWAYLFRALLNRFNKGLDLFSIVLMCCVAVSLTGYSFYLSQYATRNSLKRVAPTVELQDTREVSEAYEAEMGRIARDYATRRNDINTRYDELVQAEQNFYTNQITANEAKIDQYKKREWSTGQRYTSRINGLESKNLELETKLAESVKELKQKQNGELAAVETWRATAEQETREEKKSNKSTIADRNQVLEEENRAFANMFATLVARFAAWSVILVILFTGYLEVFYFKTGIKRVVKFRTTDFQAPVFVELLAFPYVYLSRHLANFVRSKYHTLPELMNAPGTEDLMADGDFEDISPPEPPPKKTKKETSARVSTKRKEEDRPDEMPAQGEKLHTDPSRSAETVPENLEFWLEELEREAGEQEPVDSTSVASEPEPDEEPDDSENVGPEHSEAEQTAPESESDPDEEPGTLFYQAREQRKQERGEPARDASPTEKQAGKGTYTDTSGAFKNVEEQAPAPSGVRDLDFDQQADFGVTIKHVDRRTGRISYFDANDLDAFLEEYQSKMDDAAEMYHDTGDPMYLASIEDARSGLSYWQGRRVELMQKISSNGRF